MKTFFFMAVFAFCFSMHTAAAEDAADSYSGLAARIMPAVVTVIVYEYDGSLRHIGSGFFYNGNGDMVTNSHVLTGNSRARIKTGAGKTYSVGMVIERDTRTDIVKAKTHIKAPTPFLPIASHPPAVGDRIIVAGSPMGLEQTFTEGIVSAWRTIPEKGRVLQISAPISPGSSGGPVLNMAGQVVGIATFQMIKGQNLNFAVPAGPVFTTDKKETRKLKFYTDESGVLVIE